MSKVITSPVKRFPGTVTIPNPPNFAQWMAWIAARQNALLEKAKETSEDAPGMTYLELGFEDAYTVATLPGVLAVVEQWNIEGVPEAPSIATFPAAPRRSVGALVVWLAREIDAVMFEDEGESPNE